MFFVEDNQVKLLQMLFDRKNDNEYIVLSSNGRLTDIAQYSMKYQNIHFVSVPSDKLDKSKELY